MTYRQLTTLLLNGIIDRDDVYLCIIRDELDKESVMDGEIDYEFEYGKNVWDKSKNNTFLCVWMAQWDLPEQMLDLDFVHVSTTDKMHACFFPMTD